MDQKGRLCRNLLPADKEELGKLIDYCLDAVKLPEIKGDVISVISPHAGYSYSGPIAAYSYKLLERIQPEVGVLLAPSHRASYLGASLIDSGSYETPFGSAMIDEELSATFLRRPNFFFIKEAHEMEHSLEVQIPFLQRVLKKFTIVPMIIGTTEPRTINKLADSIATVLGYESRRTVIVISTDLSHYHSYETARVMDGCFIEGLMTLDENRLRQELNDEAEACGEGPVMAGLMASRKLGANSVEILCYANSGDTSGEKDRVVGYVSAAMIRQ